MIAGTMPRWLRYTNRSPVVVVILFGTLVWRGFYTAPSHPPQTYNVWPVAWMSVLGLSLIASVYWFWRRLITEFQYDGRILAFSTLASSDTQIRDLSAMAAVSEWTGRGGSQGYYIKFRNGSKLYLQNGVSNATTLAERLCCDLGSPASERSPAERRRPRRLAILLFVAIGAGVLSSLATYRLLQRLPPEISRAEFFLEVEQGHVAKVVITDRDLISGTSTTRGAFRVRMPVDDLTLHELRSRGVVTEFETSSDLIP